MITKNGKQAKKSIVVYDTAICNLNCKYCTISKNPALCAIDKELEESFKDPNYYYNLAEYYYGRADDLESIEVWGGEPLLHLDRVFPLVELLINKCTHFSQIVFSSNYTHNNVIPSFKGLMALFAKYPDRKFQVFTQISIDGPEDITDTNRGVGTTQRILNNFNTLMENDYFTPDNVEVHPFVKITIDKDNIVKFLDEEYNYYYFQFFEDHFVTKWNKQINKHTCAIPVPGTTPAIPNSFTKEDGLLLAKIVKLQEKIYADNEISHRLPLTHNFCLFRRVHFMSGEVSGVKFCKASPFCKCSQHFHVGLLPHGFACACDLDFANYYTEYAKYYRTGLNNQTTIDLKDYHAGFGVIFHDKSEYDNYINRIDQFRHSEATALLTTATIQLRELAKAGQVEEKYLDINEANIGAQKLLHVISHCPMGNLRAYCTPLIFSAAMFKFYCNGALDYIYMERKNYAV